MSRIPITVLLLLAACEPDIGLVCGAHTTEVDGACVGEEPVEPEPPDLLTLLDSLAECDVSSGDGRIDLAAGCADDVCVGKELAELESDTGETATCEATLEGFPEYLRCAFSNGATVSVFDFDLDGEPDPGQPVTSIDLDGSYDGTSADGLGIGTPTRCFFDLLGEPNSLNLEQARDGWKVRSASFSTLRFSDYGAGFGFPPSGAPTSLTLTGQSGSN